MSDTLGHLQLSPTHLDSSAWATWISWDRLHGHPGHPRYLDGNACGARDILDTSTVQTMVDKAGHMCLL